MSKQLAFLALALVAFAGVAQAAPATSPSAPHHKVTKALACSSRQHVSITDEYGFHYDSRGDRLNANGCVIPPPHTKPGAKVL